MSAYELASIPPVAPLSLKWTDGTTRTISDTPVFGPLASHTPSQRVEPEADLRDRLLREHAAGLAADRERKVEGVIYRNGQALVTFYDGAVGMSNGLAAKLGGEGGRALRLTDQNLPIGEKIARTLRALGIPERDVSVYDLTETAAGPRASDNAAIATEEGLKAFLKQGDKATAPYAGLAGRLSALSLFQTQERSQWDQGPRV